MQNTAVGSAALTGNTGSYNTAVWLYRTLSQRHRFAKQCLRLGVLKTNTTGNYNTALGYAALYGNTTGTLNTATGDGALFTNTEGGSNTADGTDALYSNTTGSDNTAVGQQALYSETSGGNTGIGYHALYGNASGYGNTATGYAALSFCTGYYNTAVGFEAGIFVTTASDVIAIDSPGGNVNDSCFIGRIRSHTTQQGDAIPVVIDSHDQLGMVISSRRFKKEIKPMDQTSEAIFALKPVTFRYNSDGKGTAQFGLIAEEVAKVNPDLIVRDKRGEIYSVRDDQVNAMLLNEFLKEHRKVEAQQATIRQL